MLVLLYLSMKLASERNWPIFQVTNLCEANSTNIHVPSCPLGHFIQGSAQPQFACLFSDSLFLPLLPWTLHLAWVSIHTAWLLELPGHLPLPYP